MLRISLIDERIVTICTDLSNPSKIGPITDRRLAPGAWRELDLDELRALERLVATVAKPDPAGR